MPYFPDPSKPKEASPYREPQAKTEPLHEPAAVVVSRPEPLPEPLVEQELVVEPAAPTRAVSPKITHAEARALLAVDRVRHTRYFRPRVLVVPATLLLWRYNRMLGSLGWLVYPLLVVSAVLAVLEIDRIWRRTEL